MPIEMTDAVWKLLVETNDEVNRMPYRTDLDLYGRPEFWEIMGASGGDCEDFALTKRARLVAAGLDGRHLLPATGKTRTGDGHAVLLVETDRGTFVLDNVEFRILSWTDRACSIVAWEKRATPEGTWVDFSF